MVWHEHNNIVYIDDDDDDDVQIVEQPIVIDDDDDEFPGDPIHANHLGDGILMYTLKLTTEKKINGQMVDLEANLQLDRMGHIIDFFNLPNWLQNVFLDPHDQRYFEKLSDEFDIVITYRANNQFYNLRYEGYVPYIFTSDDWQDGDYLEVKYIGNNFQHRVQWTAAGMSMSEVFQSLRDFMHGEDNEGGYGGHLTLLD